jgi:competence protein ComEA
MRSRRSVNDQVADVARRRLELLSAELAEIRPDPVPGPWPGDPDGSGEPPVAEGRPDPVPGRHAHRPVGPLATVSGWLHDRMPSALQGRARFTGAHVAAVLAVVAAGLALTAWWVVRAHGGETPVPPVAADASLAPIVPTLAPDAAASGAPPEALPSTGGPGVPGSAAVPSAGAPGGPPAGSAPVPAATAPSAASVVVDVSGKVRRPGIATLPAGSRVVDALEAAGGARRGVRLGSLNLARVLTDGEQIVVGVPAPPGVAASAASAPTSGAAIPMVNINTASQAELEELPGIGPVTAQSILRFRAENGTFTAVDELLEVSGIGDATLAKLAPYVTL